MKKLLIVFLLLSFYSQAQTDLASSIRGTVVDKASEFPLEFVEVVLTDSDPVIGAVTDAQGKYRLENVPVGRHTITVFSLGYKPIQQAEVLVVSAKELVLNFKMEEEFEEIETVKVKGRKRKDATNNEMSISSTRLLSIEEAGRFSGSLGDPARMAQNYAGVSGPSDDRNDIIVRGNSPLGVLWRMEGVDIPSPNHFSNIGTTGGPVSMLNINNLANSDFMTGAWSADYGNALSGVFDLKLRNGNSDKAEFMGQIGFNGFELGAEGPLTKKKSSSYMINYRFSTLQVFDVLGFNIGTGDAIPEYQDITFSFNMPSGEKSNFKLWGFGGFSSIHFEPDTSGQDNLFNAETDDSKYATQTGAIGLTHSHFFTSNTLGRTTLFVAGAGEDGHTDSVDLQTGVRVAEFDNERIQMKYGLRHVLNTKVNKQTSYNFGAGVVVNDIDFIDSFQVDEVYAQRRSFDGTSTVAQAHAQVKHAFTARLDAVAGLHAIYHTTSEDFELEPRLAFGYNANEKHRLSLGLGMHSMLQPISNYFVSDPNDSTRSPNQSLEFTKGLHAVLGHNFRLAPNMRLKSELYFQHIYNVPVDTAPSSFSMLNTGAGFGITARSGLENTGIGRNYGIELTLEQFLSKGFYFLSTASIFSSEYQGSDKVWRSTAFDSKVVLNGLAGKEFKLSDKLTLTSDMKFTYAGGKPVTPIDLEASIVSGREVRIDEEAFSKTLSPYWRLDFKIGVRHNMKNISQEFSVDLQNITNNDNIFTEGFIVRTGSINETYQRGFFPDVRYRIYF